MILNIDATLKNLILLSVIKEGNIVIERSIEAKYSQGEKILPEIKKILKEFNFKLNKIKSIKVNNKGGAFTSLRSSVVIANALAYLLNIPILDTNNMENLSDEINIIKPIYDKEPNIT